MLTDLLINLLAAALWDLIQFPTYRGSAGLIANVEAPARGRIGSAIRNAAVELSKELGGGSADRKALKSFLESNAVCEIVTDIFASGLADRPSYAEIRVAFDAQWREHVESSSAAPVVVLDDLFAQLVKVCESVLNAAINDNVLAAHEAKSAARQRLMEDRLETIQRLVATTEPVVDRAVLSAYERRLTSEVGERHARIEPPSFQVRHRVPLDKIYVTPPLCLRIGGHAKPITFASFLASAHRRVVLGSPGGGKSTLTFKLCHLLAGRASSPANQGRRLTPWRIELRRYAVAHRDRPLSLVEYFERFATASYSLPPASGVFEALLDRGGVLVVFDGLDELLDPSDRSHVREAIESFCRRFPKASVVVTSRFIGYDQAPLDPDVFDVVEISDFTVQQTETYVNKWFSREDSIPPPEQQELASAFMDESQQVADLRSNPLLLALMCAFYRGRGFIPNNLPDVYGSCAQLLFETWDKSRGIDPLLPFSRHIRPALNDLAYWIFTSPQMMASGVTRAQAVTRTSEFLGRYRFADPAEARAAAEEFVEFCRGRAWVFSDTGEMRAGEEMFAFTHRTFLEFFCAEYLQASYATPAALVDGLLDRVGAPGWEIVTRVALQMKSRTLLDGADLTIKQLGYHAERGKLVDRVKIQLFVLRSLGALVPSPPTVVALANSVLTTVGLVLAEIGVARKREGQPLTTDAANDLLAALARVDPELASQLQTALVEILTHAIVEAPRASRLASELLFWSHGRPEMVDDDQARFWDKIRERSIEEHVDRICMAAQRDMYVGLDAFWIGVVDVADLYIAHSWPALLAHRRLQLSGRSTRSVASDVLAGVLRVHAADHDKALARLRAISGLIEADGFPQISDLDAVAQYRVDEPLIEFLGVQQAPRLTGDDWATVWALSALDVELNDRLKRRQNSQEALQRLVEEGSSAQLRAIGAILLSRSFGGQLAERELDVLQLRPKARLFIRTWAERRASLIG